MKVLHVILLLSLVMTVSCSKKVKPDSEEAVPQAEMSASSVNADADLIVEADEEKSLLMDEPTTATESIVKIQDQGLTDDPAAKIDIQEEPVEKVALAGGIGEYKVEKGETLMMIAFKIWGDYSKWRHLFCDCFCIFETMNNTQREFIITKGNAKFATAFLRAKLFNNRLSNFTIT